MSPRVQLADLSDRILLTLLIYGEARGEPVEGQIAVANVARNRVRNAHTTRWADIILAPLQFSCFNRDDPNRDVLERAATSLMTNIPTPELAQAVWIADGIISGACKDNSGGATNYLTTALYASSMPSWAKQMVVMDRIGRHVFLRDL